MDIGHDHIGLLEPIVLDGIGHLPRADFSPVDLQETIRDRVEIELPTPALKTLLARFARGGSVKREGGRYHRQSVEGYESGLTDSFAGHQEVLLELAHRFRAYAAGDGVSLESDEAALDLLALFVREHRVELVLDEPVEHREVAVEKARRKAFRAAAKFITEECVGSADPPVVHFSELTAVAWMKRPAVARDQRIHQLLALCASALRPTEHTWSAFVETLRALRDEGSVTSDEVAAVVASSFLRPQLLSLEDEDSDPDADALRAAVERVRDRYRVEESSRAREQLLEVRNRAERAESERARLDRSVSERVGRVASWIANAFFVLGVAVVLAGAITTLPGIRESVLVGNIALTWIIRIAGGTFVLVSAVAVVRGGSLRAVNRAMKATLEDRFRSWILGSPTRVPDESGIPEPHEEGPAGYG